MVTSVSLITMVTSVSLVTMVTSVCQYSVSSLLVTKSFAHCLNPVAI